MRSSQLLTVHTLPRAVMFSPEDLGLGGFEACSPNASVNPPSGSTSIFLLRFGYLIRVLPRSRSPSLQLTHPSYREVGVASSGSYSSNAVPRWHPYATISYRVPGVIR